ncbi:hypothetical protein C8R45DRAFT_995408 [Mycena sanguinolenta]|nr:hypothetical protein C8R45DRAFT_995408 [Mycena sanguinolenta]
MSGVPHSLEEDQERLIQWTLFLRDYAKGIEWASPPPSLNSGSATNRPLPAFDVPLYPPGEISEATARIIAEFYDQYKFLPPPRAEEETVRLQTIQEYNLFRQDQAENFHRCSSLVNTLFPFAPICTISLFHNAVQVVVSKAGEFPVSLGEELVTETSICGHVVLKKNNKTTELVETGDDWRFTGNPWCSVRNGVRGYVGVPITLEVDPSDSQSSRVTVGVIALMSNRPFEKLTDTQRKALDDLSSMLSVQLRSTWEGWRRRKEMRLLNAVTDFIQKALVDPSQQAIRDIGVATRAEPPVQGSDSGRSTPSLRGAHVELLTSGIFENAAQQLQELLEADLRWLEHPGPQTKRRILGSSSSPAYSGVEHTFDSPEAMAVVCSLSGHVISSPGRSLFGSGGRSGLEGILSPLSLSSSSEQSAERGVHAFDSSGPANRPNMLIVVATTTPFFTFNPVDVSFVSNLGLMLVAHLAQRLIVEADAAKTGISLRLFARCGLLMHFHQHSTPLHGLLGWILYVIVLRPGDLSAVPALLDSAEYCGTALRGIVDDVLHFGEMQFSSHDGASPSGPRPTLVDLAQITLTSVRACWLRWRQWQNVSAPSASQPGPSPTLGLVVDFEDRRTLNGWFLTLDASGFMQILNNLVTNSLKYTAEGLITVSLVSGSGTVTESNEPRQVILRVEDTGRGMAPEFLDRIFDPFTQADSFSSGAGLGLNITKTIVERMGGTIALRPAGEPRTMCRTYISSERPATSLELPPSPSGTPPETDALKRLEDPPAPRPPTAISPTFVRRLAVADLTAPLSLASARSDDPTTSTSIRNAIDSNDQMISAPFVSTSDNRTTTSLQLRTNIRDQPQLLSHDNAISRKILVTLLKRLNATAHQADDGINAVEVFQKIQPHVVWTMDGVTAAGEMRKIERERGWPPSYIVAITGLGLSDEHIRGEALTGPAALDAWLIKGQNLSALKEGLVSLRRKLRSSISSLP